MLRTTVLASLSLLSACVSPRLEGERSSEVRTCTGGSTVEGVDVSEYEDTIDWTALRASGRAFAFVRVSDGVGHPDARFAAHWPAARVAGFIRGAYQFFRPAQDPIAQADLLLSRIGTPADGDLPPVIDVETDDGVSGATIVANLGKWLDRVESKLGRQAIIYTADGFWSTLPGTARFANRPLWVANYGVSCPYVPDSWSSFRFWQYSESGSVAGISGQVDLDVWNGTLDQLRAFAAGGAARAPIEVYWARQADGSYALRALPPAAVTRVEYEVDGYSIGSATRSDGANFPTSYRFTQDGTARQLEVIGYGADGRSIAHGVGALDVTGGTAFYVKEMGAGLYEVGLERAPAGVAAVELRVDGILVTDGVSGQSHSGRLAVRNVYQTLGPRSFALATFSADGTLRGTWTRSFTLEERNGDERGASRCQTRIVALTTNRLRTIVST